MELENLVQKLESLKKSNLVETTPQEAPDGVRYVLSALTQDQESVVNSGAAELDGQLFMDFIRKETLCHAIVEIQFPDGEVLDLRDTKVLPTGEMRGDVPVQKEKHIYLREIVGSFPEELVDSLYRKILELKYELLGRVEEKIKLQSNAHMRKVRLETMVEQLRELVNDCIADGQTDIPMTFDFRPEGLGAEVERQPIPPAESEQSPSPEPPPAPVSEPEQRDPGFLAYIKNVPNYAEMTEGERAYVEQQYNMLPEEEKMLYREDDGLEDWTPRPIKNP